MHNRERVQVTTPLLFILYKEVLFAVHTKVDYLLTMKCCKWVVESGNEKY